MILSLVSCHCGSFFTLSTCCPLAVGEVLENFPENICTAAHLVEEGDGRVGVGGLALGVGVCGPS